MAGFVLIELLGLTGTLLVGAACSAVAGTDRASVLDRRLSRRPVRSGRREPSSPSTTGAGRGASGRCADRPLTPRPRRGDRARPSGSGSLVAVLSGLTSLAYQTLWTRLLAAGTGNYTYVFTLILALFLIGIAVGAIVFDLVRPWIRNTVGLLAVAQLRDGGAGRRRGRARDPRRVDRDPRLHGRPGALFGTFLRTSALVVLPATFVMGLSFPAASALVAGRDRRGRRAGRPAPRLEHGRRDRRDVPRPVRRHPA